MEKMVCLPFMVLLLYQLLTPCSLTAVESTLLQLSGAEDPEYLSFLLSLFFTQISQKLSYEQCKSLTETILGKLHTFWDSKQVSDLEILAAGLQPRSVFVYFLNWFYQVLHDLNGYESAELCIQTLIHLGETQPVGKYIELIGVFHYSLISNVAIKKTS